jgi:hypothetical protein
MKRILIYGAAMLVIVAAVSFSYADVARPKPSPSPTVEGRKILHTSLTVTPDSKAYEATLQISREDLKILSDALAHADADYKPLNQRIAYSSPRTIIAGLFLFLSISFAGVWLARSGQRRSHKAIAAVLLGVAVLSAAAIATHANAGPPGYVRWSGLARALNEGRQTGGAVDIEIMPEGYGMKLIVPIRTSQSTNGEE